MRSLNYTMSNSVLSLGGGTLPQVYMHQRPQGTGATSASSLHFASLLSWTTLCNSKIQKIIAQIYMADQGYRCTLDVSMAKVVSATRVFY